MKPITLILCATFVRTSAFTPLAAEPPLPLSAALASHHLTVEARGHGREQLSLTLSNALPTAVRIAIPAGFITRSRTGDGRMIVLRSTEANVPAQATLTIALPSASLSSKGADSSQPFMLTDDTEPHLDPLLKFLAGQPDTPRSAAQLAVFCLVENITFARWLSFRSVTAADEPHPTPAEVAQAIEVLGILREIAPRQTFALQKDGDLKLRALRNPWCRAKAMQIYGLQIGDGALPPDIGQLLHAAPGDNCPVCRQRTLLQSRPGAP